jgi:pimeloyl-ACP methyl ester carboxylesterase
MVFSVKIPRVAGLLACLAFCDASSASDPPQHLQSFPVTSLHRPTRWAPCALDPAAPRGRQAECARVTVPLDYEVPGRGKFSLLVKRVVSPVAPTAQVWFLNGGPSESATAAVHWQQGDLPAERQDIVYYAVDHRGMGGSEHLTCAEMPEASTRERWSACVTHLQNTVGKARLDQITMSNAARDIGTLIGKYRLPGVRVFIHGASYGTSLAQRYLQLFPEQVDGVILEGVAMSTLVFTEGGRTFSGALDWDQRMNMAVPKLFERCALAEECAGRFEAHPWEVARRTMASLYAGHCAGLGIGPDRIKSSLGMLVGRADRMALAPALIKRLHRCNDADRTVLRAFVERWDPRMSAVGSPTDAASNPAGHHISLSEVEWAPPAELPALERQFSQQLTVAFGVEKFYTELSAFWPAYPRDALYGRWSTFEGPMLMLQGGLDTYTTYDKALYARAHFKGPHQNWVVFPEGAHTIVGITPTLGGQDCGRSIFVQFLDDPKRALDRSCLGRLKPIDWNDGAAAQRYLGTPDAWGDGGA